MIRVVRSVVADLGSERALRAVAMDARLDRDLGLASLERVELLLRIEKQFGVTLAEGAVMAAQSPRDLARAVSEATSGSTASTHESLGPVDVSQSVVGPLPSLEPALTLIDALRNRAEQDPQRTHITLREYRQGEDRRISYGSLWRDAAEVARSLRGRGIGRGDTVALMLRTEEAFFSTFMGILLAGAIPVPLYPPLRADRVVEYGERQVRIFNNAQIRIAVTFESASLLTRILRPRIPSLEGVLTSDELRQAGGHDEEGEAFPIAAPHDPALIQYTSGSTGDPKGVLLTHANLLSNIRSAGAAIGVRPDDVGVSWLPLYHDMGLIGSWLFCLYYGIPITLLSPLAFLSRPERWLWTIHDRRATLSPAPNFAYELCAGKIDPARLEGLDLSSWRIAFNGAEPVSPETLDRFVKRFEAYGFRREAMLPVYGLAESSVGLTIPPLGRGPWIDRIDRSAFERDGVARPNESPVIPAIRFVSCGRPLPGHSVRIVDDRGEGLPERREGRLQFNGPSMMAGYYRNSEATSAVLHEGWIDSGDLAYQADGEIFITGRRKDIVLIAGRNIYPQEVEEAAGGVAGIRRGFVAAFGIPDPKTGTERLVIVAETRETEEKEKDRLAAAIVDKVTSDVDAPPDVVVLSLPGSVPKTSSGKIRRDACRKAYLEGKLTGRRASARRQVARLAIGSLGSGFKRVVLDGLRRLYGLYTQIVFLTTVLPVWSAILMVPSRRFAGAIGRAWAGLFLRLVGCPVTMEGAANLEGAGASVYVANHAGEIDPIVLMAVLPASFRFVAKREIMDRPLIRTFVRKAAHLTVDRRDPGRAREADRIASTLREGASILFFPEGTYTRAAGLRPFALGAFKAAAEMGRPVIPIGIRGTRTIYQEGRWPPRAGKIRIAAGTPIEPRSADWKEMVRLRDAARAEVARLSGERLLDLVLPGLDPDNSPG